MRELFLQIELADITFVALVALVALVAGILHYMRIPNERGFPIEHNNVCDTSAVL